MMNSEMVNPIPHSAAPPRMRSRVSPGPNSPSPEDAEELADHESHDDAPCQGGAGRVGEDLGVQHDARVGEGEQRKDVVRDIRGVGRLEALVDRDGFAQAVRGGAGVLGVG
jgi:hypothetical protein